MIYPGGGRVARPPHPTPPDGAERDNDMNIGFANAANREHAAQNALTAAQEADKAIHRAINAACTAQMAYEGWNTNTVQAFTEAIKQYRKLADEMLSTAIAAHAQRPAR